MNEVLEKIAADTIELLREKRSSVKAALCLSFEFSHCPSTESLVRYLQDVARTREPSKLWPPLYSSSEDGGKEEEEDARSDDTEL